MTIPIELTKEELAEIKRLTKLEDEAAAVSQAARDFVRFRHMHELMAIAGKVDYDESWLKAQTPDISETDFPQ